MIFLLMLLHIPINKIPSSNWPCPVHLWNPRHGPSNLYLRHRSRFGQKIWHGFEPHFPLELLYLGLPASPFHRGHTPGPIAFRHGKLSPETEWGLRLKSIRSLGTPWPSVEHLLDKQIHMAGFHDDPLVILRLSIWIHSKHDNYGLWIHMSFHLIGYDDLSKTLYRSL